jgi:hypothetical protein
VCVCVLCVVCVCVLLCCSFLFFSFSGLLSADEMILQHTYSVESQKYGQLEKC